MPATKQVLAFDLGAESGRALVGKFDGQRLGLDVVHRFPNGAVQTLDTLHWDVLRLYGEMVAGLRKAHAEHGDLASMGVDTWGVDFALVGRDGTLLGNPRHYRDPHTEAIMDQAFAKVPRAAVFRQTGIQFMRFNSLFQILALMRDRSPLLDVAESMLFIPDLFNYWFTGIKVNEYTDASTSQMLDPAKRTWARDLIRSFGIPDKMLGTIIQPGTVLGPLRTSVANQAGVTPLPVIAPATHDTAAAVAAVPAQGDAWAYISSGTWSLMGVEVKEPQVGDKALVFNFTNEGGVGGTIRLLKNIAGLWLVQECRRTWEREGKSFTYEELMKLAEAATPPGPPLARGGDGAVGSIVNPDDASFVLPTSMPAALADYCRKTGQCVPADPGAIIRCALDSLALRYRWVLERLEELTGRRINTIHIVGGGCRNTLLCQLAADCCNRTVVAGPVEATALGNVLVQMIGLGLIKSLAEGREIIRRSFEVHTYEPRLAERWGEAYKRFVGLIQASVAA